MTYKYVRSYSTIRLSISKVIETTLHLVITVDAEHKLMPRVYFTIVVGRINYLQTRLFTQRKDSY